MESEDTMFFGELLRSFRLRRNLTQQQLAEQIGSIEIQLVHGSEENSTLKPLPWFMR